VRACRLRKHFVEGGPDKSPSLKDRERQTCLWPVHDVSLAVTNTPADVRQPFKHLRKMALGKVAGSANSERQETKPSDILNEFWQTACNKSCAKFKVRQRLGIKEADLIQELIKPPEISKIASQYCPLNGCQYYNHNYLNYIKTTQPIDSTHGLPAKAPKNRPKLLTGIVPSKQE